MRSALPREERVYRELEPFHQPLGALLSSAPSSGATGTCCCSKMSGRRRCRRGRQPRRVAPRARSRSSTRARMVGRGRVGYPGPSITSSPGSGAASPRVGRSRRRPRSRGAARTRLASGLTSRYRCCGRAPSVLSGCVRRIRSCRGTRVPTTRASRKTSCGCSTGISRASARTSFDAAAFAQAIEAEGGPPVERTLGWYAEVSARARLASRRLDRRDRRVLRGPLVAPADPRSTASSGVAARPTQGLARMGGAGGSHCPSRRGSPRWLISAGVARPSRAAAADLCRHSPGSTSQRCACTTRWSCARRGRCRKR